MVNGASGLQSDKVGGQMAHTYTYDNPTKVISPPSLREFALWLSLLLLDRVDASITLFSLVAALPWLAVNGASAIHDCKYTKKIKRKYTKSLIFFFDSSVSSLQINGWLLNGTSRHTSQQKQLIDLLMANKCTERTLSEQLRFLILCGFRKY